MKNSPNPGDAWLHELMKSPRAREYIPKLIIFFEIAFYSSLLIGLAIFLYLLVTTSA
jgi:hypothetical protein